MAEWVRAAALDAVSPGTLHGVEINRARVVLANVDGEIYALQDRCSHADFPLNDGTLEGTEIECAHHGARFDVCSGRALCLPAIRPVPSYDVEIRDGEIFIHLG
ncbi:MAG: non-heme iron oxygenase ferredoxin subunit [Longimicrobiales bacterium]|nr:non-heme iron oxygenase ferredoxin subunit [Longimicrobiales bacterium]